MLMQLPEQGLSSCTFTEKIKNKSDSKGETATITYYAWSSSASAEIC